MKLAEALAERRDLASKMRDFGSTATEFLTYEEDDARGQDVREVEAYAKLDQITNTFDGIRDLSVNINKSNNEHYLVFENQTLSLMHAIALRDSLAGQVAVLTSVLDNLESGLGKGKRRNYYGPRTKDQVRLLPVLPLQDIRNRLDASAARLRRLDIEIQKANWQLDTSA